MARLEHCQTYLTTHSQLTCTQWYERLKKPKRSREIASIHRRSLMLRPLQTHRSFAGDEPAGLCPRQGSAAWQQGSSTGLLTKSIIAPWRLFRRMFRKGSRYCGKRCQQTQVRCFSWGRLLHRRLFHVQSFMGCGVSVVCNLRGPKLQCPLIESGPAGFVVHILLCYTLIRDVLLLVRAEPHVGQGPLGCRARTLPPLMATVRWALRFLFMSLLGPARLLAKCP